MINARLEFLEHVKDLPKIKAVELFYNNGYYEETEVKYLLALGYNEIQYANFIASLAFNYDNGYGGQELEGTIWYIDGTWSTRGEYDGAEWWEYNKCPEIPDYLL